MGDGSRVRVSLDPAFVAYLDGEDPDFFDKVKPALDLHSGIYTKYNPVLALGESLLEYEASVQEKASAVKVTVDAESAVPASKLTDGQKRAKQLASNMRRAREIFNQRSSGVVSTNVHGATPGVFSVSEGIEEALRQLQEASDLVSRFQKFYGNRDAIVESKHHELNAALQEESQKEDAFAAPEGRLTAYRYFKWFSRYNVKKGITLLDLVLGGRFDIAFGRKGEVADTYDDDPDRPFQTPFQRDLLLHAQAVDKHY